jgi:hypothetical protein
MSISTPPNETPVPHNEPVPRPPSRRTVPQVIVYSHSWLVYWWPVWVVGYIMAWLTWLHPVEARIDGTWDLFAPSRDLGVVYTVVLLLVILFTNTHIRGMTSVVTVVVIAFFALLFAYLGWWSAILRWFGNQYVHMSLGFYVFFSTGLFVIWALTVFVFDRLSFWRVRPGQITHEFVLGAVDKSYDTETVVLTKQQGDIFRNWVLGLGSGDLRLTTMGGTGVEITLKNVMFAGRKEARIQRLIATRPD